ncbi:MAG: alcohol dehydrogenase [Oceanospirillaceae bacterium]|nr:alcohol dehydrogenase [Oceanospirillaceae bacterium]MBT13791.1 alcohol dehydrogenase [Oceanospirillaceae bacterium]|tara:strand:+ start:25514 stop:26860 length:1347 start_codon:yes stop_codon:yes gene_type:complete
MKKFLIVIIALIVIALGMAWYGTSLPASTFDTTDTQDPAPAELIEKGEYIARAADCVACHSTPESKPFAGGLEMATPMGIIYATNITPDKTTGIGHYTLADFERAVRQGVTPEGKRLYPAMPYPSYVKMTDDDIEALFAYFKYGVEPVMQENKESTIPWPLNMRWPLAYWNIVFTDDGVYQPDETKDDLWNRGAYLVQAAGHCGSCHTERGMVMQEKALDESSDLYLAGATLDGWYAPSLRNDHNIGLGRWSESDVVDFLKHGRNEHAVVYGSMTDAYNNSTQFLTDNDLKAMAHYLKSLPGNPQRDGAPWTYDASTVEQLSVANRSSVPGAKLYYDRCSACHGVDGKGKGQWIPPLAGSASSMASTAVSSINATLNGSGRVVSNGVPDAYRMPPYRQQLDDEEMAELLTFIRTAWGNTGGPVSKEEVAELRADTDPASSDVIVLQMR